jgi:hypothetical protein
MDASESDQLIDQQEREAAIACAMQMVIDFVDSMAGGSPEACERKVKQLNSLQELDRLLPEEFKRKVMRRAREEECISNMRRCDALLREAVALSVADRMAERTTMLNEARKFYQRAAGMGAGRDWCKAFERSEEAVRLTGGMHHGDPSRAKPQEDAALRAPNRAKFN